MKIAYTKPVDGSLSIVIGSPKESIEKTLGTFLTNTEYSELIWKTVPEGSINPRQIDDSDIPSSREFRNAWVDTETGSQIDISCTKAKEIALKIVEIKHNAQRKDLLDKLLDAIAENKTQTAIKNQLKALKLASNPLNSLNTVNKVNDQEVLNQIRTLRDTL